MFDHLVQRNDLYSEFEKHGVTENDRDFIKEQIKGPLKHKSGVMIFFGVKDRWVDNFKEMSTNFFAANNALGTL